MCSYRLEESAASCCANDPETQMLYMLHDMLTEGRQDEHRM